MTLSKNEKRVFYAIAQLFNEGNTSITRHSIYRKVGSIDRKTVYRILEKFQQKNKDLENG